MRDRRFDHLYERQRQPVKAYVLVRFLTEKCLGLKEYADGLHLRREDLVGLLHDVEQRLFRVTLA